MLTQQPTILGSMVFTRASVGDLRFCICAPCVDQADVEQLTSLAAPTVSTSPAVTRTAMRGPALSGQCGIARARTPYRRERSTQGVPLPCRRPASRMRADPPPSPDASLAQRLQQSAALFAATLAASTIWALADRRSVARAAAPATVSVVVTADVAAVPSAAGGGSATPIPPSAAAALHNTASLPSSASSGTAHGPVGSETKQQAPGAVKVDARGGGG